MSARGVLFACQFVLLGALTRGAPALFDNRWSGIGALASVGLWSVAFTARRAPGVRVMASCLLGLVLAADALVVLHYGVPFDRQVAASAVHGWADVRPILVRLIPVTLALATPTAAVEWWLLAPCPSEGKPRGFLALSPLLLALIPGPSRTPDASALDALALVWATPQRVTALAETLPTLPSLKSDPPDVLFVLTESVRSTAYCTGADPCPFAPEVSALFPDRVVLREMRSVASYTALSVSALFTGRAQAAPREEIEGAPTLFDLVHHATVSGHAPWMGYWSAQSIHVWDRDPRPSLDALVTLETLMGRTVDDEDDVVDDDIDDRLAARFERDVAATPHPAVLVLHLLGTHAPYFVDPARAPFQPVGHVVSWAGMGPLRNAYEDSVVAQDHRLARCLRTFLAAEGSRPWLVVFTSDNGEAFGEHGAIHHGQNLYEEQVHVPAWVAASPTALTRDERGVLASHERAFVTHLDVLPTLLDAIGLWRSLPLAPFRARMLGRSSSRRFLRCRPSP